MTNEVATDNLSAAAAYHSFGDLPFVALRYSTPTAKGLIDAGGRFRYAAHERITFSVGHLVVGPATGALKLTTFDLGSTRRCDVELAG